MALFIIITCIVIIINIAKTIIITPSDIPKEVIVSILWLTSRKVAQFTRITVFGDLGLSTVDVLWAMLQFDELHLRETFSNCFPSSPRPPQICWGEILNRKYCLSSLLALSLHKLSTKSWRKKSTWQFTSIDCELFQPVTHRVAAYLRFWKTSALHFTCNYFRWLFCVKSTHNALSLFESSTNLLIGPLHAGLHPAQLSHWLENEAGLILIHVCFGLLCYQPENSGMILSYRVEHRLR